MEVEVRLLEADDAAAFFELRQEALRDSPLAFTASPGDDLTNSPAAVREWLRASPDQVIVGAFAGDLIGSLGLTRFRHVKASHKMLVWGGVRHAALPRTACRGHQLCFDSR